MVLNEAKITGDTISATEYNTIAATVNDVTTNGLPQNLTFSGTTFGGLVVNSLTTTQRDALSSPANGTIIYNSTLNRYQIRQNGSWLTLLHNVTLDSIDMNNLDFQNIRIADFYAEYNNGSSGTSLTINWGNGNYQKVSLSANCTFAFTAPSGPTKMTLKIVQDAAGSKTVTWPSMKWVGAASPTLTTTGLRTDFISIYYDGSAYWGAYSLNFN